MNHSNMNIVSLCEEMLLAILKKLDNIDVLYSLVGINTLLDRLARDITFTQSIDLVKISSNEHHELILARFFCDILPRIRHNIISLTLDRLSIHHVLWTEHYLKLRKLTLVNLPFEMVTGIFNRGSSFVHIFKHKILHLSVTINENSTREPIEELATHVFTTIFTMFTNLIYLHFGVTDDFSYSPKLLTYFLCIPYYSSNIVHLNVRVRYTDDCLCLLNRRFNNLHTFIVQVDIINNASRIINNAETLCNLKCFSLTSFWTTSEYDNVILPLLRQMSNLEQLTLSLLIRDRISFIDGNHLVDDIINKKPYLYTFIFDIVTDCVTIDEELLPTPDDVRRPLIQRGYEVGCYMDYCYNSVGRCHIYSLPFTMKRMQEITIKFPGGLFTHVHRLVVHDFCRSIEHDFFIRISQAFPLLKHMTVSCSMEQKKKESNKLDECEQLSLIVKYTHLQTLNLLYAHIDYAKQFLFDSNTCLPCLNTLYICYDHLTNVTENFTNDAAHANCVQLKNIVFRGITKEINGTNFFNYFPSVLYRFSS